MNFGIRKIAFSFLTAISFLGSIPEAQATFHLLIVADVEDASIGQSVAVDVDRVRREFETIADHLNEELNIEILMGEDFSKDVVLEVVEELEVEADDVVVFYYSGHGFHSSAQQTVLPIFHMDQPLKSTDVAHQIYEKNPRFSLILSDCCNSYMSWDREPQTKGPAAYGEASSLAVSADSKGDLFKKLFMETEGMLIMTGSATGEYSFCNAYDGGYFTHYLFSALHEPTELKANTSWSSLFNSAAKRVTTRTSWSAWLSGSEGSSNVQHPQFHWVL